MGGPVVVFLNVFQNVFLNAVPAELRNLDEIECPLRG